MGHFVLFRSCMWINCWLRPWLAVILPSIISPDQTTFFLKIKTFKYHTFHRWSTITETVISLDTEKVFDRVEWGYLFWSLKKLGFGPKFISWVKLLYNSPTSSVRNNNTNSQLFPLQGGKEHKTSLYADDLLLYIIDPQNTLGHIMTLLGHFSSISRHKIYVYLWHTIQDT